MNWQLIETAPKDGTPIIAYTSERCDHCDPDSCGTYVTRWKHNCWYIGKLRDDIAVAKHQPSHWMPLPEPPNA